MRRSIFAAVMLAVALTVTMLSSCGGEGGNARLQDMRTEEQAAGTSAQQKDDGESAQQMTAEGTRQQESITVVTTFAGEDANAINYQQAVKDWQEKTGYRAEDDSVNSSENFKKMIIDQFREGEEPDVLFYFTGADATPFIADARVVSIEEVRKDYPRFADNLKEEMIPTSLVDGDRYAVPVNGYWEGLYYNSDILKKAGVTIPGGDYTMEQFEKDCEKIKAAGFIPIAASLGEVPHYWWEYMIFNHEKPGDHDLIPASASDRLGRAWVSGIEDIRRLYQRGFFPENTLSISNMDTVELFTGERAAFLLDGSWRVGSLVNACQSNPREPSTLDEKKLEKFGVTYCPGMGHRKATDIVGGMSMGYYIARRAYNDPTKRDLAVSFVEHMTSDEVAGRFAAHTTTALKTQKDRDVSALNSLQVKALDMLKGASSVTPALQDLYQGECRESTFEGMPELVTDNRSISEAVEEGLIIYHAE